MKVLVNIVLFFLLIAGNGLAQPIYKAQLLPVGSDGFYAVDLSAEILGGASPDLSDVRILDGNGKEVAWLLKEDIEQNSNNEFIPFQTEIVSEQRKTDLLIDTKGKPLSSFILQIKNADADKNAFLLGSNDRKNWFVVKEHLLLTNTSSQNRTNAFLNLEFPLSDYQYYKLSVNDSLSAPLNVIGVGMVKNESYYKKQIVDIPVKKYTIGEDGKYTDLEIIFPFKYQIEGIVFYISYPQYYNRDIKLYLPATKRSFTKKRLLKDREHDYMPAYYEETLSADNGNPVTIGYSQYTDTLKMSIYNGDDQPLTIDSVKTYTSKLYLIAGLKKGNTYTLTYGDKKASFPNYDLSFGKQLPDSIQHISVVNIEQLSVPQQPGSDKWLFFFKTYGVWLVIAFVIVQILLMVRKIIRQKT